MDDDMDDEQEALEEYLEILHWVKKRVEPIMEEKDVLLSEDSIYPQTAWFAMLQLAFKKNLDKGADPNELIESILSIHGLVEDGSDEIKNTIH